jgi:hypothetical protein
MSVFKSYQQGPMMSRYVTLGHVLSVLPCVASSISLEKSCGKP